MGRNLYVGIRFSNFLTAFTLLADLVGCACRNLLPILGVSGELLDLGQLLVVGHVLGSLWNCTLVQLITFQLVLLVHQVLAVR